MILCSLTMTLGTVIGGYGVIKTVGMKVAKLEPYQGTATDLASSVCLLISSLLGLPVSSNQTKTTAIMGVGAAKRLSSVNWKLAKNMVITWIITFPAAGILGYITTIIFEKFFI